MKSENTKKTFMFVTPVVLILLLTAVAPALVHPEEVDAEENDYIVRAPIRIDGNDDFAAQAADESWPGDGSEGNPYVIEGYEIDGTGHGYGIYVGNTTMYFVVRGCYVHNASGVDQDYGKGVPIEKAVYNSGIILFNARNGVLENNIMTNNIREGIHLYASSGTEIVDNKVLNNDHGGIHLSYSNNNVLKNNTISDNIFGITLAHSSENTIIHNEIDHEYRSQGVGINLQHSNDNNIKTNTISNYRLGIFEDTCDWNLIEDNTFMDVETEYDYAYEEDNGNNGDNEISFIGFSFTLIAIMIAALTIWIKKDKIRELKK